MNAHGRTLGLAISALVLILSNVSASAETFRLKLASGNAPGMEYVDSAHNYFVPEFTKRVAQRTRHTVEVEELYSGTLAKGPDVLDATAAGTPDIGLFCVCHVG